MLFQTIHLPRAHLSGFANNGFVAARDDHSCYIRILHSKRQVCQHFDQLKDRPNEKDAAHIMARLKDSCLPEDAETAPYQLEGHAAFTCCRAVLTLKEPTTALFRPFLEAEPGVAIDTTSQSGISYAFVLVGGAPLLPAIHVCYSKPQLMDVLRPLCARMGGEGIWDFRELERKFKRSVLPKKSPQRPFQVGDYAGLHLLAALGYSVVGGLKNEQIDALFT